MHAHFQDDFRGSATEKAFLIFSTNTPQAALLHLQRVKCLQDGTPALLQ